MEKCEVCGRLFQGMMADGDDYEFEGKIYNLKVCYKCDSEYGPAVYELAARKRKETAALGRRSQTNGTNGVREEKLSSVQRRLVAGNQ